jgi:hypothetical protein
MKIAVITAFPPSKVTLNEYGHLAKNFAKKMKSQKLLFYQIKPRGKGF